MSEKSRLSAEEIENGVGSLSLDDLMGDKAEVTIDDNGLKSVEYDFCCIAEWPDEEKPKLESRYRRLRPVDGSWVLLGNDELWLIPKIDMLGKDVEIVEEGHWFTRKTIRFTDSYKHHGRLRVLLGKLMDGYDGTTQLAVGWSDAYMLMYLALQVNYKIPASEINRVGLLRQEHVKDVLAALIGAYKKKGH